jgi:hypothetical protein
MRLRIETLPPLPPLKTWLNVTPSLFIFGTRTISDLQNRLIKELGLPKEIKLQLKGYDLLPKESIEGLLEKDDLIL